ncbi:MAG: hypothetical protein QW038_01985 [Nanopusillaceae archaeon]
MTTIKNIYEEQMEAIRNFLAKEFAYSDVKSNDSEVEIIVKTSLDVDEFVYDCRLKEVYFSKFVNEILKVFSKNEILRNAKIVSVDFVKIFERDIYYDVKNEGENKFVVVANMKIILKT